MTELPKPKSPKHNYSVLVWENPPKDKDIPFTYDEMTDEMDGMEYEDAKLMWEKYPNAHCRHFITYEDEKEDAEPLETYIECSDEYSDAVETWL